MTYRRRPRDSNPFERNSADDFSVQNLDTAIFGEFGKIDAERQIAEPTSIDEIYPDKTQPRRAIPSAVRSYWDGEPDTTEQMFDTWLNLVNDEREQNGQPPVDLAAYLKGSITERSEEESSTREIGPIEAPFFKVVELAASIRRDGLTNPITVVTHGNAYRLETGERRWLAYHLLRAWFDGSNDERPNERDKWSKIPARAVDEINVWRQASENSARENLNAIGKARQFAILLMDLLRAEGQRFVSYDEAVEPGGSDRGYYAQVANAKVWPIPHKRSEPMLNAMGVSNRSALARYRSLLNLPDMIWEYADENEFAEEVLYDLARMSPEEALAEFRKSVAGRNTFDKRITTSTIPQVSVPGTKRYFSDLARAVTNTGPGKDERNQTALEKLQELEHWLEEQKERIRKYME